jgi:hypothetical protein
MRSPRALRAAERPATRSPGPPPGGSRSSGPSGPPGAPERVGGAKWIPSLRYSRSSPSLRPRNEGHGRPHRGSHHQRPPTGTRAIGETTRPCRRDPPGASPPPDPHPETGRRSSSADRAQPHAIACSRRTSLASLSSITRSGTITHVSPSTSVDRFTESSPEIQPDQLAARPSVIRSPARATTIARRLKSRNAVRAAFSYSRTSLQDGLRPRRDHHWRLRVPSACESRSGGV